MVGCGAQSPYMVAAALYVLPGIERVTLVNPHNPARAAARLPGMADKVAALLAGCGVKREYTFVSSEDTESAVRGSDVILTATPAREPMIRSAWVQPGTHFSCIGADMSGKQELDTDILRAARVFGDDAGQCFAVGECEIPHREGALDALAAEIGDVILGKAAGRVSPSDVTVFDSTGIALQDLASGAVILDRACELGEGIVVEL